MYARLSPQGLEAIHLAEEQAREMGHEYLGTEHLLLGLLAQRGTTAGAALQALSVDAGYVRAEAERIIGPGERTVSGSIPLTPLASRALAQASAEAQAAGRDPAAAEDLLLGLASVPDGLATRILLRLDVSVEELRAELARRSGSGASGSA